MKKIMLLALPLLLLSCGRGAVDPWEADPMDSFADGVEHGMIELGDKLADPYALSNVQAAVASLYPTKASRIQVEPTDLYVRFLPADEAQFARLKALGIPLLDHPVDYRVVREGDYYHDPSLGEGVITWQYSVVGKDFQLPRDIRCEVLEECYIGEHDPVTRGGGGEFDWEAVEREAYRLTGNEEFYLPPTKSKTAEPVQPKGRITIADPSANGGQPFGVAGVQVSCNAFVKFSQAYTDRDVYYTMPLTFSSKLRYRLVLKHFWQAMQLTLQFFIAMAPFSVLLQAT